MDEQSWENVLSICNGGCNLTRLDLLGINVVTLLFMWRVCIVMSETPLSDFVSRVLFYVSDWREKVF